MSAQANRWPQMGQLFVEQGRLTNEQLDSALAEQQETGQPLGEILVAREHISRIDLAAVLSKQWTWQREPEADAAIVEQPGTAVQHEVEHDGRLVADLQARVRAADEQFAASEARLATLEEQVSDLTKAFGVLQRFIRSQTEELEALRAASSPQEALVS
jgi:hypothetical protein